MRGKTRKGVLIFALALALSAQVPAVSYGWGLSVEGWSGYNQSSSTRVSLSFDPTPFRHLTFEAGASVGITGNSLGFTGFDVGLTIGTFRLTDHIFSFMFANQTIWSPAFSARSVWDGDFEHAWSFGFSPLRFLDVHFAYDFLKPWVSFTTDFGYAGWGIDLVRVTWYS